MKVTKFLTSMLVLFGFVVSCGGGAAAPAKDEKITLKIATWNVAAKSLSEIGEVYEKDHPNIDIEVIEVDPTYTKLTAQLSAGTGAPDIFTLQNRHVQGFIDKFDGQLLDITDRLEKDGLIDKFLPVATDLNKRDGRIYAFPWDIAPVGLFYRTDLFEKAGIKIEDVATYEGYIEAGKKLQKALPDVHMTDYLDLFPILFNQLNGQFVVDGKININSPEAKQAFELMVRMLKEGTFLNQGDWDSRIIALTNSKIASIIYPVWYVGTFVTQIADQKGLWKIAPIPAFTEGGNQSANLGGSSIVISTQSQHPDEAYEFIKYALTDTKNEDLMASYGLFPSYIPYYSEPSFKINNEYFGMDINSFFADIAAKTPSIDYGAIQSDSEKTINDLTPEIIGGKDIDQALSDAANTIQRITNAEINK